MLFAPSPARARPERFIDVAAAPSGGAWVLVELDDPRVTGWRTEVRRAGVEEQVGVEQVPTATRIMAIGSDRDGTLWLLTLDEVLRRDARGRWARAALPPDPLVKRDDRSLIRNGEIQPIAPGCALVVRLCPARGAEECSDVFEVEMATGQVTSQRLGVRLDRPIADGRGGAWVTIPRMGIHSTQVGYAHFLAGAWTAFTMSGKPPPGMRAGGRTTLNARATVAEPPGFWAIGSESDLYHMDGDGHRAARVATRRESRADRVVHALVLLDSNLVLVDLEIARHEDRDWDTPADLALVLRRFSRSGRDLGTERVPTPSWSGDEKIDGLVRLKAVASGHGLWIMAESALFYRGKRSHVVAAERPRSRLRLHGGLPVGVGRAFNGDRSHLALSLRPELIVRARKVSSTFGLGPFVELGTVGGDHRDSHIGAGLTWVAYGDFFGVAASVGAEMHWVGDASAFQWVYSGFAGYRPSLGDESGLDPQFGFRVDLRPATDVLPGTITASLSLDALMTALGAWFVAWGVAGGELNF